jgi:DeoR/GlpR family transcriptional regulator of sugar metabolism
METLRLLKDCDDLTIVTNSTEAIKEFVLSEVTLLSTGGMLNKKSLSLQGDLAEKALEYYNIEVAVISAKGIDMNAGITDSNEEEAKIKRKMIDQAREVVLLIDTSKLGRKAFVKLIDFERIHTVVLEKQPDDEWMHFFEKNNVNVIY